MTEKPTTQKVLPPPSFAPEHEIDGDTIDTLSVRRAAAELDAERASVSLFLQYHGNKGAHHLALALSVPAAFQLGKDLQKQAKAYLRTRPKTG